MHIESVVPSPAPDSDGSSHSPRRDELRVTIQSIIRDEVLRLETGRPIAVSQLRTKLRHICADARRHDPRAERLLILIKDVWNSTPEAQALRLEAGVPSLLTQIVTTAIDEFYEFAVRLEDLVPVAQDARMTRGQELADGTPREVAAPE